MTGDVINNLRSVRIEDVLGALWELSGFEGQPDVEYLPSVFTLISHSDAVVRERVAFVIGKYDRVTGVQEQIVNWTERENDQTVLGILIYNLVHTIKSVPELAERARCRLALLALDSRRDPDLRLASLNCLLGAAAADYANFDRQTDETALSEFANFLVEIIRK